MRLPSGAPCAIRLARLSRTADGATIFRVHDGPDRFMVYQIQHDDLGVTIDADELTAFYRFGEHEPSTTIRGCWA